MKRAATAAKAKARSRQALQSSQTSWMDQEQAVMEEINLLKAEQCEQFRKALIDTGTKTLIHNMEGDDHWGFGKDGKGENIMGVILMSIREYVRNDHDHDQKI